jgi:putative membrane protein
MILAPNPDRFLHLSLWGIVGIVLVWSFFGCHDRFTWFLEVSPVIFGTVLLLKAYPYWRFTRLVCWLMALHAIVLMVGGHYTYAEVPLFNWLRDSFHLDRNYYDRVGHFMQGFVPALIAREILIRRRVLKPGPWLFFIVVCICLAISAAYELLEAAAALMTGTRADAFLGTQGDPWDTQWDMLLALIGAVTGLALFSKFHDREMGRISIEEA